VSEFSGRLMNRVERLEAEIERLRARLAEAERLLRKAAKARHPSVVSDLIGNYFAKGESRE
jgi:hypothetical protein